MATVIDVTETAQEMVRVCQELKESGLLEQVREIVATADAYLRRATQAARDLQPPAEHARPPVADVGAGATGIGRQLREHRTLVDAASKETRELHAYVTELEHLWRRLAA